MNQEEKNRIIFLDIDGVLNSKDKLIEVYKKTHKSHSGYNYPFDERCLHNLKHLVEETDSYIVITSTWRRDEEGRNKIIKVLKEYDLDYRVIGYTPILNTTRGEEIKAYLKSLSKPVDYIIIDDDSDMDDLIDHLHLTNNQTGLTKEDTEKIIKKNKK